MILKLVKWLCELRIMVISIIAALDSKNGIGKDNKLLFKIPEDFKRMKSLSTGHPIIMGRKTFESIGRLLPGRTNIVITHNASLQGDAWERNGLKVVGSIEDALSVAKSSEGNDEVFIFGGAQIFEQILPKVDRLYLTLVEGDYGADTFFPDYSEFKKVISEVDGQFENLKYKFLDLER